MLTRLCNTSETRAVQIADRTFKFIISDESVDRYGTVIKLDGWDLSSYAKNGIVAYQHITFSDNPDMIVGKGTAYVEGGNLIGEVEFEPLGDNPIADKLVKKLAFGSIRATSVGFNPTTYTYGVEADGENKNTLYFRKQDLLEWSIVNIPANANAVKQENALQDFVTKAFASIPLDELPEAITIIEESTPEIKTLDAHATRMLHLRLNTLK